MSSKQEQKEFRANVAEFNFCRSMLYLSGFLTEKQNEAIQKKLLAYAAKRKVEMTYEQMCSVSLKYTGK